MRFHMNRRTGAVTKVIERGTKSIDVMLYFMLFNIAPTALELTAVAVIFYELLTRRRPFDGPNSAVIMHRVFTETPVPPSAKNELLTPVLDPLVAFLARSTRGIVR